VDLGCGTGELTRKLADALPDSDVIGIDSSPEMLKAARSQSRDGLRFEPGDQARLNDDYDLIFSNAALHWTEDHPALIAHLLGSLRPGGQIAVQVPSNHQHISHRVYREIAAREPFSGALRGFNRQSPVLPIEAYADILFQHGTEEIIVFEKVYAHVLENTDAVVDWISGTALVPYFERLSDRMRAEFTTAIRERLRLELPSSPVFYPFKRIFFSAVNPG
jgi:trans-aconitate 2-methyltransferase